MNDLKTHYRVFHPIVAPFLSSVRQIRARFVVARRLLLPRLENRSTELKSRCAKAENGSADDGQNHNDMLQWLIDTAKGRDSETDQIVKRMLFLNMAAIHTTADAATNVILDLCARPEYMKILREEMVEAIKVYGGLKLATLTSLKKADSFIQESNRFNSGLSEFKLKITNVFVLLQILT